MACHVPAWQGLAVAERTSDVPVEAMPGIDKKAAQALPYQPWSIVKQKLTRWIDAADHGATRRRMEAKRATRKVWVSNIQDGHMEMFARLDARDGIDVNDAVTKIAATLPANPDDLNDLDKRRATALGMLARQAYGQDTLPTHMLVVHINASDPAMPSLSPHTSDGLATVERWGHILSTELPQFLKDSKVVVRPIIDPAGMQPLDRHDPSQAMRFIIEQRNTVDVFPYATRSARNCDLDHTSEYYKGIPAQTRLDNLGPMSRLVHRAKTHNGWHVAQTQAGTFAWTSPLGYRYLVTPTGTLRINQHTSQLTGLIDQLITGNPSPWVSNQHPTKHRKPKPTPPSTPKPATPIDDTPPPF